ncbi:MSHA biogenesis protein MshP [Simiduia litorea]|uniref:MSHA biogenesis protein MshP n=1 Tax=Simiduia litorea TaxID=1435348 RepID=UPI0036F196EB
MYSQRGFLMPLAIFIIVAMGGFALTMARTASQSNTSAVQAMIAIQAFYAADSGAQWGMNQLFYDAGSPISRSSVDAKCVTLSGQSRSFNTDGLRNCRVELLCTLSSDPSNTISYYQITSASECGNEPIVSQRTVELSAFMK